MKTDKDDTTFLSWIGLRRWQDMPKPRWLGSALGFALSLFALFLISLIGILLFGLAKAGLRLPPYDADTDGSAIRNIGLVVAAVIGAPFVIWRSYVAAKQAAIQDEALFNDKINAAATDLAARRQITRVVKDASGNETVLTEWQDDLVTRAAAIDRLEGLAHERPRETPRIARMLSIYVREITKEAYIQAAPVNDELQELSELPPSFKPERTDTERAAQTLGRLKNVPGISSDDVEIDLREANLQGFDLAGANFNGAHFNKTLFHGANLRGARLQRANLSGAKMPWTALTGAKLRHANLFNTDLQGADLTKAEMNEALLFLSNLDGADISGAIFHKASLRNATLVDTKLRHTDFRSADLAGINLRTSADKSRLGAHESQFENCNMENAKIERVFFLRSNFTGANFRGAVLNHTTFTEANLDRAQFDNCQVEKTKFHNVQFMNTSFTGAQLLEVLFNRKVPEGLSGTFIDLCALRGPIELSKEVSEAMSEFFADGSVTEPSGVKRPRHWNSKRLADDEFIQKWQAWIETRIERRKS